MGLSIVLLTINELKNFENQRQHHTPSLILKINETHWMMSANHYKWKIVISPQ